jgi:hypothetical protein
MAAAKHGHGETQVKRVGRREENQERKPLSEAQCSKRGLRQPMISEHKPSEANPDQSSGNAIENHVSDHPRQSAKKFPIAKGSKNHEWVRQAVRISNAQEVGQIPKEQQEYNAQEDSGSVKFPARHSLPLE